MIATSSLKRCLVSTSFAALTAGLDGLMSAAYAQQCGTFSGDFFSTIVCNQGAADAVITTIPPTTITVPAGDGIFASSAANTTINVSGTTINVTNATPGTGFGILGLVFSGDGASTITLSGTNSITLNGVAADTDVLAEHRGSGSSAVFVTGILDLINNRDNFNLADGLEAVSPGTSALVSHQGTGTITTHGGNAIFVNATGFATTGTAEVGAGVNLIVDNTLSGATFTNSGIRVATVNGLGTVTTAATIQTTGNNAPGIFATASGSGPINVAHSGAITTSGTNSHGITAQSVGGPVSVLNAGSIVVNGSAIGVLPLGPASTVDSAGLISSPLFAVQFVSGTNNLFLRSGSTTVGTVQMGSGSDHTTVFGGATITGVPKFDGGLGSSILTFDGYSGPVNAIDPWVEVQVLNGSNVVFSGADVHIANLFRIDSTSSLAFSTQTGTLTGDVLNEGQLDYSAGNGAAAYDITGTLTNSGTVTLAGLSGVPGNTLTVSSYVGAGGTLAFNTFLGADSSPSDKLVIDGGTATGNSLLQITNAGGQGALTVANGILVVDTVNGGTTAPGTFALAEPVVAGPFEYTLFRGSVDGTAPDSWFLRSTLPTPGPEPCPLPTPEGPTPPGVTPPVTPPGQAPNFRPEVSLNAALPNLTLLYGRSIVGTLHERVGDEVSLAAPAPVVTSTAIGYGSGGRPRATPSASVGPAPARNGAWGRIIAEHGDRDGGCPVLVGPSFDYGFAAVQAGFDAIRLQHAGGARDRAGVYGVFGSAHADVQSQTGADAGRDRFAGYSAGGYWTHYGAWGWYLDSVVQGTFYDVRDASTRLPALETDGWGFAASLEAGVPFKGLLDGWRIEPQAQLIYQTIDLDDSGDIAARVRFEEVESLAGRLGVRFATNWAMPGFWGLQPALGTAWFRPSYWHEFNDDARTLFSSAFGFLPFRANIAEDWVELNTGLTVQVDRQTALFANSNYDIATDGDGEAWEGKIGLKVVW